MYSTFVQQFARSLENLSGVIAKARNYAQERGFDENNFLTMRLAPDMLPFVSQVRIACDTAKNLAARAADEAPPSHPDDETSLEELQARIAKVTTYLRSFDGAKLDATDGKRIVPVGFPPGQGIELRDYLVQRQVPNFYFHMVTAYALLRHGGVAVGKSDYLGALPVVPL